MTPEELERKEDSVLGSLCFRFRDVNAIQRFSSLLDAVEIYGSIFGQKAIQHL